MTQTDTMVGQSTGGKAINLNQLESELRTAGVDVAAGLGLDEQMVYTYDADGVASDFPSAARSTVDSVVDAHVAMRDKTDAELAAEFQDPNTTPSRKQEIRDMQNGLMPREQVPMT